MWSKYIFQYIIQLSKYNSIGVIYMRITIVSSQCVIVDNLMLKIFDIYKRFVNSYSLNMTTS